MITHGQWHGDEPHRPIIYATFSNPRTPVEVALEFLIDTGADQTFIVPEHQRILQIPSDYLQFETKPVHTLGGVFRFNYLKNCTLAFTSQEGETYEVTDITAYFAFQQDGFFRNLFGYNKRPLVGEGKYPSILGRDVLHKLCLGFCKKKDLLFTSRKIQEYCDALQKDFSKRPDKPTWFGTKFEIGDYGIIDNK